MRTITLYVDHIARAVLHDDDRTVEVTCHHTDYGAMGKPVTRKLVLDITASDVHVSEYTAGAPPHKPGDVLVSIGLIDATRRLYNLVGDA